MSGVNELFGLRPMALCETFAGLRPIYMMGTLAGIRSIGMMGDACRPTADWHDGMNLVSICGVGG